MRNFYKITYQILLLLLCNNAYCQFSEWRNRDFGIGVIKYNDMQTYSTIDTIYADCNIDSKILAILNGRNLITPNGERSFAFKRMIEYDYETPGWAILELKANISWAKITLDPNKINDPPTGWIKLEKDNTSFILWSDLLPGKNLFFLDDTKMKFFEAPDSNKEVTVQIKQFKGSDRYDYIMKPLEKLENWLRIELYSPNPFCKSEKIKVESKFLWIKYLRNNQRPNVFFYTRGC